MYMYTCIYTPFPCASNIHQIYKQRKFNKKQKKSTNTPPPKVRYQYPYRQFQTLQKVVAWPPSLGKPIYISQSSPQGFVYIKHNVKQVGTSEEPTFFFNLKVKVKI